MRRNKEISPSLRFVILLGIVSLFADITYEGARSIIGPYLAILGASGAVVGVVSGFGELIGYGFRLVSGYVSDRTKKYWALTIAGYALNQFTVPLLAFAGSWPTAACLIIAERFGKAVRNPARDAMLSYATQKIGRGWGFGLHGALDQSGAVLGPLLMAFILYWTSDYQLSFAVLIIPVLFCLTTLIISNRLFPHPEELEPSSSAIDSKGFSRRFWLYVAAVSFVGAGYIDYSLISYHFQKAELFQSQWIPLFYALAMSCSAILGLIAGHLYDRKGIIVLIFFTAIVSFFPLFVFMGNAFMVSLGMLLWGGGLGVQNSIMRAAVANFVPKEKRGSAYGILNLSFGVCWFIGSALIGFLYDYSLSLAIAFSLLIQLCSLPLFWKIR